MDKICQTCARRKTSENLSIPPSDCVPGTPFRFGAAAFALFLLSCLTPILCDAQSRNVVCRGGAGYFEAEFATGVKVRVGAAKLGELENRVCESALSWGDQRLVVSDAAPELDVDAFGVDLGMGVPVVAVQVKKSKAECCMEYRI
jgi:hypothetical protein